MDTNQIEGNVAIHEWFISFKQGETEVWELDKHKAGCIGSLSYHKDWLWLMPVVEKIGDEHDQVAIFIDEGEFNCTIKIYGEDDGKLCHEIDEDGSTLHEAVWNAVFEYVKYKKSIENLYKQKICGNCLQKLVNDEGDHTDEELKTFHETLQKWAKENYIPAGPVLPPEEWNNMFGKRP